MEKRQLHGGRSIDHAQLVVRDLLASRIDKDRPRILDQLGLREREWQAHVLGIESRYWRAVGAVELLISKAQAMGQQWLKGCGRHAIAALHR